MSQRVLIAAVVIIGMCVGQATAQLNVYAIDVMGDSISKGFNASSASPCSNSDQENYNWLTSDTHGQNVCGAGSENVFSVFERMECATGSQLFPTPVNHAESGATLVDDLVPQATNVKAYLQTAPSQRLAVVFLGHNDNCAGTIAKTNTSCASPDLDPANYCKTRPDAFERELRKGLDILITIGNTRVGVMSPVRVSQLCNFGSKTNCAAIGTCSLLWSFANICGSLTRDCSNQRVIDAYNTVRGYRDIIAAVAAEYEAIAIGESSPRVMIGGQMVGGALKAAGTEVLHSDAAWFYRFSANQLSCCDCFHPSAAGQDTLGRLAFSGLTCSRTNPCCRDTGDPLSDGKCLTTQRKAKYYRGLF
jgi:hypothetical protein